MLSSWFILLGWATLNLLLAAALGLAWQKRVELLPWAVKRFAHVELSLRGIHVSWVTAARPLARLAVLDAPFDSLSVTLVEPTVYTPFAKKEGEGGDEFVACKAVVLRALRAGAPRTFDGHAMVDGAAVRFVSYDRKFKDTNLKRLATVTATRPADARPAAEVRAEAAAAEAPPRPFTLRSVRVLGGSISVQLNLTASPSGGKGVLPPILLQDETVQLAALSGPPGLALLAWLNGLVFRAIALSSVSAVRDIFDVPGGAADELVGRSLDLLDSGVGSLAAAVPGGRELGAGVTGGARVAWAGARLSVDGLLDSAASTASGLAVGASNGDPIEFLKSVRAGAHSLSEGAGGAGAAGADGAAHAGDAVLGGADTFAARLGPAEGLVTGATGGARGLLGGAAEGATAGARGAASAAGQVCGGVLGGAGGAGKALLMGDARELRGAGEELAHGLASGTHALAEGTVGAAGSAAGGVGKAAKAVAHGLGESACGVGKGVKGALAACGGVFGERKGGEKGREEAR